MIDVIIPSYNSHNTIKKTLLSLLFQTIKDKIKIYIVDDASNKPYDEIINRFKDRLNITIIRLDENKGPGNARNVGIEKSSNPYILFLDADDELYNSFTLEHLVKYIEEFDMCYGGICEEKDNNLYSYYPLHQGCLHGKLYKRSVIDKYNLRLTETKYSEDNYFNQLYNALVDNIHYIGEPAYVYKNNAKSLTKDKKEKINYYYNYNMNMLVKDCIKLNVKIDKIKDIILSALAYNYKEYISSKCLSNYYVDNPKKFIIEYYLKYKNNIYDFDIKLKLNEHQSSELEKISFIEYLDLILLENKQ